MPIERFFLFLPSGPGRCGDALNHHFGEGCHHLGGTIVKCLFEITYDVDLALRRWEQGFMEIRNRFFFNELRQFVRFSQIRWNWIH